jgi:ATP synthase protein I
MTNENWRQGVDRDTERLRRAERARRSVLAQTVYLGSLSVLFLTPVLAGAYLGRWLDGRTTGFTVHWTVNLIVLGVALGALNVYLFVRKYW